MNSKSTDISLKKITSNNKQILRNLFNYYCHDLIGFGGDCPMNKSGTFISPGFKNWYTHPGLKSFFIYYGDKLAGFVVVSIPPHYSKDLNIVQRLFILNGYRRAGIGTQAMAKVFARYPGKYAVLQLVQNKPAIRFWKRLYEKCGVHYTETTEIDGIEKSFVQRFTITKEQGVAMPVSCAPKNRG